MAYNLAIANERKVIFSFLLKRIVFLRFRGVGSGCSRLFILYLLRRYDLFCLCRVCSNVYQQLMSRALFNQSKFVKQLTVNEIVLSAL
jgi:hypothetical protein